MRAGLGAMAVAAVAPLSRRALADDVVDYRLRSAPLAFSPIPGVTVAGLAFNGGIPGPLLRVRYGQRVRVRYTSDVDIPTSVHWHGMQLPNAMDGVAGITQAAVRRGETFAYEFAPQPPGTRWYHDHGFHGGAMHGLFGMFVVEDPKDEPHDREFALVFHDVPKWSSVEAAEKGLSTVPQFAIPGSPEASTAIDRAMRTMPMKMSMKGKMGDEVSYLAHCINGASYPRTRKLAVNVGDRVRLRILNASPTQTRYVRLAGHRLAVTHADGNRLANAVEVDALRLGVAERYDVSFEVTRPGAFLLQGLTGTQDQSAVFYTPGMEYALPAAVAQTLLDVEFFTYEKAGDAVAAPSLPVGARRYDLTLGGGTWGANRWTINGKTWPDTPKILVRRGDDVVVAFRNETNMEHPMHLHGHVFALAETAGTWFAHPLQKDVSLVPPRGGTATWHFTANARSGRWLLHCHNDIHMLGGMMTEVVYDA